MNTKLLLLVVAAALVAMASSSTELNALRSGSAKFSTDLFSVLREGKEKENLVVSPISLQIALAMLYAGARGNTKAILSKTLHVETEDLQSYLGAYRELLETLKDPVLSVASTVFVDKLMKLHDTYKTSVSNAFGANVESVDFKNSQAAAQTINQWCEKHTNGRIKDMFSADALQDAVTVLVNAVYFKASWKTKFDSELTAERDFKSPSGIVKVQMMNVKSRFHYTYSEKLDAQVLELPYANDKFRMLIILPSERTSLKNVENKLKTVGLEEIMNAMDMVEVDVYLPRFKIEMTLDLNEALRKLGAEEIFSDRANLSGMADGKLMVSQVKQKVFLEVTEEGTEAAAVTVDVVQLMCRDCQPIVLLPEVFNANRPFSFILLPTSGYSDYHSVLFHGSTLTF